MSYTVGTLAITDDATLHEPATPNAGPGCWSRLRHSLTDGTSYT